MMRDRIGTALLLASLAAVAACGPEGERMEMEETATAVQDDAGLAAAFDRELARIEAAADSVDAVLHPLPLLRPAEEERLRTYLNPQQLPRARQLGVPPGSSDAELERMRAEGRLVRLEESNQWWIVRELDYSSPYVTPDAEILLREIGERFQARLADIGLPPFRFEITSVLRSAEDQERLRQVNPNAAAGVSTHQFGTTFDIAYNAYAAPAEPIVTPRVPEAEWLEQRLLRVVEIFTESVAARRAREIEAILGHTLIELQNEGMVMVIMERLQPVYHMTVARRLAE